MTKRALAAILTLLLVSILTHAFNLQSANASEIYFTNRASIAGVDYSGSSRGVAFADYDNDGDLDLYVSYVSFAPTVLFRNNGDNTFTDVTSIANVHQSLDARGLSFADYDNDGDLDLFVADYYGSRVIYFRNNGDGTFSDRTSESGFGGKRGGVDVVCGDYDNDGYVDIYTTSMRWDSNNNVLYQNNGNGTFSDVTASAGVGDSGPAAGVACGDYDNDGDLDILINKYDRYADVLYRNNGDGTFTNVADMAGIDSPGYGHAVVFGDYDNDGDLDVYLGEAGGNQGSDSHLFRNDGDGSFTDVTDISGMGSHQSTDAVFFDYDNDGDLDLMASQWNIGNYLWNNNGDGTFTDVADLVGVRWHHGGDHAKLAVGDYDNDGDLDIFGAAWNKGNFLYENNGGTNNWLEIELLGTISNKSGIGAKVKVITESLAQMREISSDVGGESQQSVRAHFGLGAFSNVDLIEVVWPSGMVQVIEDVGANQILRVVEIPEPTTVDVDIKPGSCPNPLNVKFKGVLPVAILGTEDVNVIDIDVASIRLEDVEPNRSRYEDVATPVSDANDCNCTEAGSDGFLDLTLKFKTQKIVNAIGDVNNGDVLALELTGVLFDETPIEGVDCVLVRGKHKPFNRADFNTDGKVDMADFAEFASNWLQSSIVED